MDVHGLTPPVMGHRECFILYPRFIFSVRRKLAVRVTRGTRVVRDHTREGRMLNPYDSNFQVANHKIEIITENIKNTTNFSGKMQFRLNIHQVNGFQIYCCHVTVS